VRGRYACSTRRVAVIRELMRKLGPRLRHSKPECELQKSETPNVAQFGDRLVKSS
jgi:hypothetical protein